MQNETESAQELYNRGVAFSNKEDWDAAIAEYTGALCIDADDEYAYFNRAYAYYKKGEYAPARADLDRVYQLKPDNQFAENLSKELQRLVF